MIFIYECLILVLMIINIACAQCPSINKFSSSDGVFYAMMTVPFPYNHNKKIKFHVQLSIGAPVSKEDLEGKLSFLGTTDVIEKQQPLSFKLLWPAHLNDVTRKITQITVNNQNFCLSDRLRVNDDLKTVTEINLSLAISISTETISVPINFTSTLPPLIYPSKQQSKIYYDMTTSTTTQPIKQIFKNSQCYMPPPSKPLIAGGSTAKIGDYPFLGALAKKLNPLTVTVICGVTLITDKLVLTAGHCIEEPSIYNSLLLFGISDITDTYNDNIEIRKIKNYIIHPDYKNTTSDADLAVLELSKHLEFSTAIYSVCLCDYLDCFKSNVYRNGVVAGWGQNEMRIPSKILQTIETRIVDAERCLWSDDKFFDITSSRTFCAGDKNGRGPCKGDSGSGFYMYLNERWIIRGVVSRSLTASDGGCNLDEYIVYVDVSRHFNWVNDYINKNILP